MPNLNNDPTVLVGHFKALVQIAEEQCGKKRLPKLRKFLKERATQIIRSPATPHRDSFGCFPGGLLFYVLNVLNVTEQLRYDYFRHLDNLESIRFVALFHYMGHLGDTPDQDFYIEQNDQYYNNKLGFLYKQNPMSRFSLPVDRLLYMVHAYEMPVTDEEYLALRNYGGAYHKENYAYVPKFSDLEVLIQTASLITTRLMTNKEFLLAPTAPEDYPYS